MSSKGRPKRNQVPPLSPVNSVNYSCLSQDNKTLHDLLNSKFQTLIEMLKERDDKIEWLESKLVLLEGQVSNLRLNLEDIEVENRATSLIISGEAVPSALESEETSTVICDLLWREMAVKLSSDRVVKCYRVGRKKGDTTHANRNVLLQVTNQSEKQNIFRACKKKSLPFCLSTRI